MSEQVEQISLLPEEALTYEDVDMELTSLPLHVVELPSDFLDSILNYGVMYPVVVSRKPEGGFRVIDGRRRIAACHKLVSRLDDPKFDASGFLNTESLKSIPVRIVESANVNTEHVMSLIGNTQRGSNPVSEVLAITQLLGEGYTKAQITEATGMHRVTIDKRLRLAGLPDTVFAGLREGKISRTTAEKITTLPLIYQEKIADKLEENDTVTMKDVKTIKADAVKKAVSQLPIDMMEAADEPKSETIVVTTEETEEATFHGYLVDHIASVALAALEHCSLDDISNATSLDEGYLVLMLKGLKE